MDEVEATVSARTACDLSNLAIDCLRKHWGEDAWDVYKDEVRARYDQDEHGDADAYWEAAEVEFNEVVKACVATEGVA